jgi:hypothetical protein
VGSRNEAVVFDLQPDDDDDDDVEQSTASGAHDGVNDGVNDDDARLSALADPFGTVRAFVARQPRRRMVRALAATALVLVLAVGSAVAVRQVRAATAERERVAALLASPGGVRDVSGGPLVAAWTVPVTGPLLGTLPGLVLVADGGDGVALRVADGSEAWRTDLGGNLACGVIPQPGERAPAPERLVCVAGPAEARRVTVLGADGVVVERALGDTTGADVYPAPGAGLLTVRRTGDPVPQPTVTAAPEEDPYSALMAAYPDGLTTGQGATVTVTDAVTGEERWSDDIPFTPVPSVSGCGTEFVGTNGARLTMGVAPQVFATFIDTSGCGVVGAYLPDGTPFPEVGEASGSWFYRYPDPDGGFADFNGTPVVLRDERGSERFSITGYPAFPLTTDGVSSVRLEYGDAGLSAVGADGATRWTSPDAGTSPLIARVGGLAVGMAMSDPRVVAVSMADGTVAWSSLVGTDTSGFGIGGAVNDGTTVVFSLNSYQESGGTTGTLVGVDVRTGTVWTEPNPDGDATLWAVDGHVIAYDTPSETEMYLLTDGDHEGETVSRGTATVRLLVPPSDERAAASR